MSDRKLQGELEPHSQEIHNRVETGLFGLRSDVNAILEFLEAQFPLEDSINRRLKQIQDFFNNNPLFFKMLRADQKRSDEQKTELERSLRRLRSDVEDAIVIEHIYDNKFDSFKMSAKRFLDALGESTQ